MKKLNSNLNSERKKGQILVLMAFAIVGLIAIVGLVVDLGMFFVSYSRLNRAADSAALAATHEFKRNYDPAVMTAAAKQLLSLNEINDTNATITVNTCKTNPGDPELCTTPARKLVRVTVNQQVPLYFLSVIGLTTAPVQVKAISEAATVDVMVIVDTSGSMTDNAPKYTQHRDPTICNYEDPYGNSPTTPPYDGAYTSGPDGLPGECHPFEEVKWAAMSFAKELDFEHDRMGIVVFDRLPHIGECYGAKCESGLPLSDNYYTVTDAIKAMHVYEGSGVCPFTAEEIATTPNSDAEPCQLYDNAGIFRGADWCPNNNQDPRNPSKCGTTNIGGGLALANLALNGDYTGYSLPIATPEVRKDSVWVVIIVSDGWATAGYSNNDPLCPAYTWGWNPPCTDHDASSASRHLTSSTYYDSDDYTRDMADLLAGNGIYTFTVGLGDNINSTYNNPAINSIEPGSTLLQYIAVDGPDSTDKTRPYIGEFYNVGQNANDLQKVFLAIANKITTKLTK